MADLGYTNATLIGTYLDESVAVDDVDQFILATQKFIEQLTGRVFKADSTASTRDYDGNGRLEIIIDDCVSVTKVEWGTNQWADSYVTIGTSGIDRYYTLPANNAALEVPIRKIGLRTRVWTPGHANHRITAKWGWSTDVPDDIKHAATVIAAGMYNQNRGQDSGVITSEKIGQYSVSYSDQGGVNDYNQAKAILDGYKKLEI